VLLDGDDLPTQTNEIVQRGMALVAEGRQLFAQMTVTENLELGGWLVPKAERARRLEQAFADFPKLRERAQQLAGTMSGGEQQMVAVARAMMSAPRLLMLDEPSLGLAPKMVDELLGMARRIADAGTTVLMVEQNVKKALAVADRGYVLERGALVASGPATLLARSTVIREAYLGVDAAVRTAGFPRSLIRPSRLNPGSFSHPRSFTMSDLSMLINGLKVSAEGGTTSSAATRSTAVSPRARRLPRPRTPCWRWRPPPRPSSPGARPAPAHAARCC
jgi:ABC-type branched-subunit amino acid transport system ATPase component